MTGWMVHSSDSVAEAHGHQLVAVPSVDEASFKTDTCTTHNGYSPARLVGVKVWIDQDRMG